MPAVRYVSLLNTPKSVVEDWQHAVKYEPLKVTVPKEVAWGVSGKEILEPVKVDANNIQLLALDLEPIAPYFQQTDGVEFYSITQDGSWKFTWERHKLKKVKWPEVVKRD